MADRMSGWTRGELCDALRVGMGRRSTTSHRAVTQVSQHQRRTVWLWYRRCCDIAAGW